MRAYLIDPNPAAPNIKAIDIEADNLDQLYELIGCRAVDAIGINGGGDVVYVDDEGLLREDGMVDGFFMIDGMSQPVYGKGIVVGTDPETGESVGAQTYYPWLVTRTAFYSVQDIQRIYGI